MNAHHIGVAIFSANQKVAEEKMVDLVSTANEEIMQRRNDRIKTIKKTYRAFKFSPYTRGYRYEEVYIDNRLRNDGDAMDHILARLRIPLEFRNESKYTKYYWSDFVHYF